jgi:hypothetical protein
VTCCAPPSSRARGPKIICYTRVCKRALMAAGLHRTYSLQLPSDLQPSGPLQQSAFVAMDSFKAHCEQGTGECLLRLKPCKAPAPVNPASSVALASCWACTYLGYGLGSVWGSWQLPRPSCRLRRQPNAPLSHFARLQSSLRLPSQTRASQPPTKARWVAYGGTRLRERLAAAVQAATRDVACCFFPFPVQACSRQICAAPLSPDL